MREYHVARAAYLHSSTSCSRRVRAYASASANGLKQCAGVGVGVGVAGASVPGVASIATEDCNWSSPKYLQTKHVKSSMTNQAERARVQPFVFWIRDVYLSPGAFPCWEEKHISAQYCWRHFGTGVLRWMGDTRAEIEKGKRSTLWAGQRVQQAHHFTNVLLCDAV